MQMYKAVIFDLDGTIADTSPGILNSIRYTQQMMGLPEITLEQMYSHVGPPMEESYNRNFGLTGDRLKQAIGFHKEYAISQGYKELVLYDGISELFDKLKSSGIKTAVATLKAHTTTVKIFEHLNMSDKFDVVMGVDSNAPMTKSQLIDKCIQQLNCCKNECVLVGDSVFDAAGAQQSAIDFIAVTYGYGFKNKSDTGKYNCTAVCESVTELERELFKIIENNQNSI